MYDPNNNIISQKNNNIIINIIMNAPGRASTRWIQLNLVPTKPRSN